MVDRAEEYEAEARAEEVNESLPAGLEIAVSEMGEMIFDGDGPPQLLDYLRLAAERLALEDAGLPADDTLEEQIAELRDEVRVYFRQDGTS